MITHKLETTLEVASFFRGRCNVYAPEISKLEAENATAFPVCERGSFAYDPLGVRETLPDKGGFSDVRNEEFEAYVYDAAEIRQTVWRVSSTGTLHVFVPTPATAALRLSTLFVHFRVGPPSEDEGPVILLGGEEFQFIWADRSPTGQPISGFWKHQE